MDIPALLTKAANVSEDSLQEKLTDKEFQALTNYVCGKCEQAFGVMKCPGGCPFPLSTNYIMEILNDRNA